ncbi:hypothetical protein PMIN01_07799 [Paraphaeosphaeria minitans]|uniref:Uncharacterized protein n=1 Tax=Paraphaeosphaeria minitans TaxID=565426 RepID=A0A9P6GGT6_9PLEO|nr:hypothetical protein PMIN01_07799 [Paraphaeosphaeria minitans]
MESVPTRQDENVEYTVDDWVQEAVSVKVCHSVVVNPAIGGQFLNLEVCPEHVEMVVLVVLLTVTETGKTFLTQKLKTSVAVTYSLGPHSSPDQPHPQPKKLRFLPAFARAEFGGQSDSGNTGQGTIGTSSESKSSGDPVCVGFSVPEVVKSQSPVQTDIKGTVLPDDEPDQVAEDGVSIVGMEIADSAGPSEGVISVLEGEDTEASDAVSKVVEEPGVGMTGTVIREPAVLLEMLTKDVLIAEEVEVTETLEDVLTIEVELCVSKVGIVGTEVALLEMPRVDVLITEEIEVTETLEDMLTVEVELCVCKVGMVDTESVALFEMLSLDVITAVESELLFLDDVLVSLFATEEADEVSKEDDGDGDGAETETEAEAEAEAEVLTDFENELILSDNVLILLSVAKTVDAGPEEKVDKEGDVDIMVLLLVSNEDDMVPGIGKDAGVDDEAVGLEFVEVEKTMLVGVRSSEVVSTPDETKVPDGDDENETEKLVLALPDGFGDVWLSDGDSVGEIPEVVSTVAEVTDALWVPEDGGIDGGKTTEETDDVVRLAGGVAVDIVLSKLDDGESGNVPDIEPDEDLISTEELMVADDEGATEEVTTEVSAGFVFAVEPVADLDTAAELVAVGDVGSAVEVRPEEPADERIVEGSSDLVGSPLGGVLDAATELAEGTPEEEDEWPGPTGGSSPLSLHES